MTMDDSLAYVLDLALDAVKDRAMDDALRRVKEAQREYLLEKAEADRQKGAAAVRAIAKLDREVMQLEFQYKKIEPTLTPEARQSLERVFLELEQQRKNTVQKKRNLF